MNKINIYCLGLFNEDLNKILSLGYKPVGLGEENFDKNWLRDNTGDNISHKNKYYGECTFHYWFWKNKLNEIEDNTWIGFCAYRRFWSQSKQLKKLSSKKDFLSKIPVEWKDCDVILGNDICMDGWTIMKLIKHGYKSLFLNPKFLITNKRNLKFHFDSFHGYGNLDKAINLLDNDNKYDFKKFMNDNNCYNRGNMFICNSKKILAEYYESLFPWLEKCESIFGFNNTSYGETRIYGFLAERYMSYWFNKYSNTLVWPIVFFNINSNQI
jgi:hypothetical protein